MIGMLWMFDPKENLDKEIQKALLYFENKYGLPTTIYINQDFPEKHFVNGLPVLKDEMVIARHIWITEVKKRYD